MGVLLLDTHYCIIYAAFNNASYLWDSTLGGTSPVTIAAEARRVLENVSAPSDIWRVQEYLSEHRKTVDRIYQYEYSDLLSSP
jgi:hypothetical protein